MLPREDEKGHLASDWERTTRGDLALLIGSRVADRLDRRLLGVGEALEGELRALLEQNLSGHDFARASALLDALQTYEGSRVLAVVEAVAKVIAFLDDDWGTIDQMLGRALMLSELDIERVAARKEADFLRAFHGLFPNRAGATRH